MAGESAAGSTASATAPRATENRSTTPVSDTFQRYIGANWAPRSVASPEPRGVAAYAAERRDRVAARHPAHTLIIPAGTAKVRSNDTDFPFRAHSAFAHLTGWGSDSVAGSVLVLQPNLAGTGHTATLYFRPAAGRDSSEFYANPEIGEFWTGPRPTLATVAADLGLSVRAISELAELFNSPDAPCLLVRDADESITAQVDAHRAADEPQASAADPRRATGVDGRQTTGVDGRQITVSDALREQDADLARELSELRLVKDAYEVSQMRLAVAATARGFDDVIADLPAIIAHPRGERLVEGTFYRRARADGNAVGYDTIAAAGAHACILHWVRNDGPVRAGELILLDAGIELDSYYTADITRTLPVAGIFSAIQRRVYDAVLEAADAAFRIVRPGIQFRELHQTAMAVIAERTAEWGLLPVSAAESLKPENQFHRRYMVHGTSHHLGLDVHDCAQARRELYLDGVLEAGMVFTIEPGLYFQPDDLTVPEEYRGIGVRIEDNILVTATGAENLSIGIPRTAEDVERWLSPKSSAG